MSDASSRDPRAPFLPPKPRAEVDDELAFHLEQRIRDYVARGMDPDAARAAALERFGNVEAVRRDCTQMLEADRRTANRRDRLDDLRQDLRFAVRSAFRAPMFTLLAVLTLAVGIGANAAVFGVVKSVLLDALPYHDADRLVRVYGHFRDGMSDRGPLSAGTVHDVAERARSFEGVAGFTSGAQDAIIGTDQPRVGKLMWVQPAYFRTLGVPAAMGRTFRDDDIPSDTARVVVLTHGAWQREFGGDPDVLGQRLWINNIPREVIGVLPGDFVDPTGATDFYFALDIAVQLTDPVSARGSHWLAFIGRLKPDLSPEAARLEMIAIADDLAREYPRDNRGISLATYGLREAMVGDTRTPLIVLMASAALVLLIACANLAGALLARSISRRKEFAVRVALGAGRGRLVRQLLTESTLLALAGAIVGIVMAVTGLSILRGLALQALPAYAELALDRGALIVTFALALATGIAFGLAPALAARRVDPQNTLRDETRGSSESRRTRHLRGALVAGQIALCVSILAGAGLLGRSLWAMMSAPLGVQADGVLTAVIQLPNSRYGTAAARLGVQAQLEERLRALPGVTGAALASSRPGNVMSRNGISIEGKPLAPGEVAPFVLFATVSDDYFRTLGIPIRQGRTFDAQDHAESPQRVVISESMARRFWPNGDAIGARLRYGPNPNAPLVEVIGIVGDVRNDPARVDAEPMAYATMRQNPWYPLMVLVRTSGDPVAQVQPVRTVLREIDPGLPLDQAAPLAALISDGFAGRRLPVMLMMAFGGLALLLASVGVYAMFASMAAAREQEFGIRVALGSSRQAIAQLVLGQGAVWMLAGLALGALGVFAVTRLVRDLLYGVAPFDPVTIAATLLVLAGCATLALLVPVRRATRVDPVSVLR